MISLILAAQPYDLNQVRRTLLQKIDIIGCTTTGKYFTSVFFNLAPVT